MGKLRRDFVFLILVFLDARKRKVRPQLIPVNLTECVTAHLRARFELDSRGGNG